MWCAAMAEFTSVIQVQVAELCAAEPTAFASMVSKTGCSSPGELLDDAEHLRGRRLLLQSLGEVISALA